MRAGTEKAIDVRFVLTVLINLLNFLFLGGKLETNVISTFIVTQTLECSFHCMDTKSCTAFNFRPIKTVASNENCQVSNITIGNVHASYVADDNWILYKKIHTTSSNNVSKFQGPGDHFITFN